MKRRTINPRLEAMALEWLRDRAAEEQLEGLDVHRLTLGDRCQILDLIDYATRYGATVSGACKVFGLSTRTMHRWRKRRLDIMAALGDFQEVLQGPG